MLRFSFIFSIFVVIIYLLHCDNALPQDLTKNPSKTKRERETIDNEVRSLSKKGDLQSFLKIVETIQFNPELIKGTAEITALMNDKKITKWLVNEGIKFNNPVIQKFSFFVLAYKRKFKELPDKEFDIFIDNLKDYIRVKNYIRILSELSCIIDDEKFVGVIEWFYKRNLEEMRNIVKKSGLAFVYNEGRIYSEVKLIFSVLKQMSNIFALKVLLTNPVNNNLYLNWLWIRTIEEFQLAKDDGVKEVIEGIYKNGGSDVKKGVLVFLKNVRGEEEFKQRILDMALTSPDDDLKLYALEVIPSIYPNELFLKKLVDLLKDNARSSSEIFVLSAMRAISRFLNTGDLKDAIKIRDEFKNVCNEYNNFSWKVSLFCKSILERGIKRNDGVEGKVNSDIRGISLFRWRPLERQGERIKEFSANIGKIKRSIDDGLFWLFSVQEQDGRWSASKNNPFHMNYNLPFFRNYVDLWADPAETALAILSFLGNGFSHLSGPLHYRESINRAIKWLISLQKSNGLIDCNDIRIPKIAYKPRYPQWELANSKYGIKRVISVYNHNISLQALVEAYAMTKDATLKEPIIKGLEYSVKYFKNDLYKWSNSLELDDIGPSVFYIFALSIINQIDDLKKEIRFLESELKNAKRYIKLFTNSYNGRIYSLSSVPVCLGGYDSTATGIAIRIFLGEEPTKSGIIAKGINFLQYHLPKWQSFYNIPKEEPETVPDTFFNDDDIVNEWYWYYGTMTFLNADKKLWNKWRGELEKTLFEHQIRYGVNKGSWDPEGPWARVGGRVYVTTFLLLTLESYFSYDYRELHSTLKPK